MVVMEETPVDWRDIIAVVLYFVMVIGVGLWASFSATTSTASGYFLAGRSTHWLLVGASTWATNIGAPMFVGLAGSAASSGIAVTMFEWHAMFMLMLLGWFFLPVYLACGCYTMPQYLKLRYGGQRIRVYWAAMYTVLTIIANLSGQIYAGALFISIVFGWDLYASVGFILLVTAIYTVIGGLNAVIWTDGIQTIILLTGSIALFVIGMQEVGGFESMRNQFTAAAADYTYRDVSLYGNRTCGFPPENAFHIFRPADSKDYPWTGMVFGLTILALNAWCIDQTATQRSLSSKSLSHGKAGALLAAYLKILPFFFFVIPGMISRILFPQQIGCADPELCTKYCGNPDGCADIAYPYLVRYMLPVGVRGLMMAALLAALMSSLTSTFNSSSTLFALDLWKPCRRKAKESELMVVSRLWTVFLAILSILWLPVLEAIQGSNFWDYIQSIYSFILPPYVCVFLIGMLWPRATEQGAFWSLIFGLGVSIIRMGLEWARPTVPCGVDEPSTVFDVVANVHYLHFACILFAVSFVVLVCVSLVTKPRPPEKLRRVTWWTKTDPELPVLSDESELEPDTDHEDVPEEELQRRQKSVKYQCMKWMCGVDKTISKVHKQSKEEMVALQKEMTNIEEDPYWKKVLDINAIVCTAVAVFLHAFWY